MIVENPASGKSHFARVKIPGNLPRLVPVDDMTDEESKDERYGFIAMEKAHRRASGIPVPGHDHQGGPLPSA